MKTKNVEEYVKEFRDLETEDVKSKSQTKEKSTKTVLELDREKLDAKFAKNKEEKSFSDLDLNACRIFINYFTPI